MANDDSCVHGGLNNAEKLLGAQGDRPLVSIIVNYGNNQNHSTNGGTKKYENN